jgi:uncharacterized damage-inducible protein DinB
MERDLNSTLLHLTRVRLLQDYPGQISLCLDVLSDEELWWRPHEQTNAVANLVLHLSGSNRYYFDQVIGGRDAGRNRDAEFAGRDGYPKARLLEMWQEALRVTEDVLNRFDPSRMMETTDVTGTVTTFGQVLLHVTHHNAAHMGQIVWITKMLHPGELDDVWRTLRQR